MWYCRECRIPAKAPHAFSSQVSRSSLARVRYGSIGIVEMDGEIEAEWPPHGLTHSLIHDLFGPTQFSLTLVTRTHSLSLQRP